jgi:predicted DNA-binding protein
MKTVQRDDKVNLRVPKETKKFYKTKSQKTGKTLSDIVNDVLDRDMEKENENNDLRE